jgi:ribosomal protein S27AE
LTEILKQKLATASTAEDLDRADLDNLINLVKIISKIRGREEILLRQSICPKCGGKIVETQKGFGHPDTSFGMTYRVGCEKCDYTLHKETIDF